MKKVLMFIVVVSIACALQALGQDVAARLKLSDSLALRIRNVQYDQQSQQKRLSDLQQQYSQIAAPIVALIEHDQKELESLKSEALADALKRDIIQNRADWTVDFDKLAIVPAPKTPLGTPAK